MEANREASTLWAAKAKEAMQQMDYDEAIRLFEKSNRMFPNEEAEANLRQARAQATRLPTKADEEEATSDPSSCSTRTTSSSSPGETPPSSAEPPSYSTKDSQPPPPSDSQGVRHRRKGGMSPRTAAPAASASAAAPPAASTSTAAAPAASASAAPATPAATPGAQTRPAEAAASGSREPTAPSTKRRYTKEQENLVIAVIRSNNHYDALSVNKNATEEEIKKSYKKLALLLHPDKNGHPRAEDAFKSLSQAFQTLTDSEKRQMYDKYGTDAPQVTRVHPTTEFMTAEELFNHIFFGGGLMRQHPGFGRRVRVHCANANTGQREADTQPRFALLIIMLAVMTFMSFFLNPSQRRTWDYRRSSEFPLQRSTENYKIPYFVSTYFDSAHGEGAQGGNSVIEIEDTIERNVLKSDCYREQQQTDRRAYYIRMRKPKSKETELEIEKLRATGTPSCERYTKLIHRSGYGR